MRRRIRNAGKFYTMKNSVYRHIVFWVLFYSLHLKKVQMKLKMLEEKGKYNTQRAEAIK